MNLKKIKDKKIRIYKSPLKTIDNYYSKSPTPTFCNNNYMLSKENNTERKSSFINIDNTINKLGHIYQQKKNIYQKRNDNHLFKNRIKNNKIEKNTLDESSKDFNNEDPFFSNIFIQNKRNLLIKNTIKNNSNLENRLNSLNEKNLNNSSSSNNSLANKTTKLKHYINNSNLKKYNNNKINTKEISEFKPFPYSIDKNTDNNKFNKNKTSDSLLNYCPNINSSFYNSKNKKKPQKKLNANPNKEIKKIKAEIKMKIWENMKKEENKNKLVERYVIKIFPSFYYKINNVLVNYSRYYTFNKIFSKKKYLLLKILKKRNQNFKKLILTKYFYKWIWIIYTDDKKSENIFSNNKNNYILYEENEDFLLRFSLVKNKKFLVECLDTNNISNNKEMYSNHYNISEIINISENNDKLDIKAIFNILFNKHKPIGKFNKTKDEFKLKIYLDNKITTLILKKCKCNDNEFIRINKEKKRILQFKKEQENICNELISENKNLIEENEKLKKELEIFQNMNIKFKELFNKLNDIQINTLNQINNIYNKK